MLEDFPVPLSPNKRTLLATPSLYECLGILNQLCLLHLIAHEIFQADMLYPW